MAVGVYWRTLYAYGVWIPESAAKVAVESGAEDAGSLA